MEDAVFDFLFDALLGRLVEASVHAKVILRHKMIIVGMGVFVFLSLIHI